MVKCANCERPASYTTADPGTNPVSYCVHCLPLWLRDRASRGEFPLVEPIKEEVVQEVLEEAPIAELPVTEEPIIEAPKVVIPKPTPPAVKKKAPKSIT